MDFLPTLWFILISVLWGGYLFLEGFDLGVGMLMKTFARNEKQRRVLLNTIGPVWDGNEVWLITAGAATFSAFPYWYASLFSVLYIPLTLVLAALIFRAVAFEYRGKAHTAKGRNLWDWAICLGSFVASFGVGAMLALSTTGLPLDANGDRVGGAFAWFSFYALLGGFGVVAFCLVHALAFLGLKADGEIRVRASKLVARWLPMGLFPLAGWVVAVVLLNHSATALTPLGLAVCALTFAWFHARKGSEGWVFTGLGIFLLSGVAAIFVATYPNVLPSTIDAAHNLTVSNASSTPYTLKFMSIVAAFGLPLVLVYQSWTYWVFRQRISDTHIPDAHHVTPID